MQPLRFALAIFLPIWAAVTLSASALAAPTEAADEIRIDVPVALKSAKVVFNMDHAVFAGDTPVGLMHMGTMVDRFKQAGTEWSIAGIFHGAAGYLLLNDDAYNLARMTRSGNPYKAAIAHLLSEGVLIEECAVTMKSNHWTNSNLLPGVKVNSGANLRIVQLEQQGYIMLQP